MKHGYQVLSSKDRDEIPHPGPQKSQAVMRIKNPLAGIRSLTMSAASKTYYRITFKTRNKKKNL